MTTESRTPKSWKRGYWLFLAVPVALAVGFCALRAQAGEFGFGHGAWGDSPEQHKAFVERRIERALDAAKATDSQRTAIKAVFQRVFAELEPIHQQRQQLHEAIVSAFQADSIDRTAVEKLRAQAAGLFDQSSQVFSKGLVDAAQVLTPQQRQILIKHMQENRGRHHMMRF